MSYENYKEDLRYSHVPPTLESDRRRLKRLYTILMDDTRSHSEAAREQATEVLQWWKDRWPDTFDHYSYKYRTAPVSFWGKLIPRREWR